MGLPNQTRPKAKPRISRTQSHARAHRTKPDQSVKGHSFDDTWGAARSGDRKHEGVDIFAKTGTPVRSTTAGIVTKLGKNRLGGKVVGIQGPGAWHYYAHLDKFAGCKLYRRVKAGEVIGYVGKTGNAKNTRPHLHYGVYLPSGAVNPYPLIDQSR